MPTNDKDEALLKEIRDRYDYAMNEWREIREERRIDMHFVAGDPWGATAQGRKDREARIALNRPVLQLDEISQYINQTVNAIRESPRAIKFLPDGLGASEGSARFRGALTQRIEYKSGAKQAYATAFAAMCEGGYGYLGVSKQYVNDENFDQEICIRAFTNPDAVLIDPGFKKPDASDIQYAFVLDTVPRKDFEGMYPNAEIKSFSGIQFDSGAQWFVGDKVQIAEYWRIETKSRRLGRIRNDDGSYTEIFEDQWPGGFSGQNVIQEREVKQKKVMKYITNGVEILERVQWDGSRIPIVPMFGKTIYFDKGAGVKRIILSLVRLARDAQMLYCFYKTNEAEAVGMVPKNKWVGYAGQFTDREGWADANRNPRAYLEVNPVTDEAKGAVLPLPTYQNWEPPIAALLAGAESARRSIQSAMGMYNSSVGKHDTNVRSGVALERLKNISDQGNFHFHDAYNTALISVGQIIDELIPKVYDTPREIGLSLPDDSQKVVKINDQELAPQESAEFGNFNFDPTTGKHAVSITTGPQYQTQHEESSAFADILMGIPAISARIAWLAVKLKNLGPIGDQISEALKPADLKEESSPEMLRAQLEQVVAQLKAIHQYAKELEGELRLLQNEKMSKAQELASKERIELAKLGAQGAIEMLRADIKRIETMIAGNTSQQATPPEIVQ